MVVLSSENSHFLWPVLLCDVRGDLRAGRQSGGSGLTLDLYGKLLNLELKRFRRSYNMVKISFFIAAVVMLSACDVPFIPGI